MWESGPCQVQGILAHRSASNHLLFPTTRAGFLSFGYRRGQVVPYAMVARGVSDRPAVPDVGNLGSLPPSYGPLVEDGQVAVAGLKALAAANAMDQYTWSAGLRWDVRDGVDLKVQADRIRAHHSVNPQVTFDPTSPAAWDGRMTALSVTLDFIFGGGR